ncbi:chlorohydrolase [Streptococcus pneumoniae]|nr:chlorohydrolase [Streptococcus pneumoniae]
MKSKEQTRKLVVGCSKYSFEVADKTDEVSSKHCFEVVDRADEVSNYIYGKATLTWFEEIFEEYDMINPLYSSKLNLYLPLLNCLFLILNCYLSNSFFLIKFSSSKTSGKRRIVSDNIFIRNKFICHFKKE